MAASGGGAGSCTPAAIHAAQLAWQPCTSVWVRLQAAAAPSEPYRQVGPRARPLACMAGHRRPRLLCRIAGPAWRHAPPPGLVLCCGLSLARLHQPRHRPLPPALSCRPLPSHEARLQGRAACVGRDGTVAAADPVAAWVVGPKGSWTMAAAALATPGAPVELAAAAPDGPAAQPPLNRLAAIGAPEGAGEPVGSGQPLAADPLGGGAAAYGAPAASAEAGAEAQPQQLLQPLPDQQEEQAPQDVQQPADQQEQQPEQQPQLAAAAEAGQQAAADAFAAVSAQPGTAAGSPADLDSLLQQQLGQPQQHAQIEPPLAPQQAQQQAQQQQPDAATAAAADEWGDDAEDADPNASTGLFIPGTEGEHGGAAWDWCAAGWRTAGWHRRRLLPHSSHAVPPV